jgi:sulfoxide reductase heme-binding subunit YedZ
MVDNPSFVQSALNHAKTLLNNRYFVWAVLALPAIIAVINVGLGNAQLGTVFSITGIYSERFLILALAITPLAILFKNSWTRWLLANRRYIGVAAFLYALEHTVHFALKAPLSRFLGTFTRIDMITGWLSLAILVAMAVTSNDYAVHRMGKKWKSLQRWGYLATALALAHWLLVDPRVSLFMIYVVPISLLTIYRIMHDRNERRQRG